MEFHHPHAQHRHKQPGDSEVNNKDFLMKLLLISLEVVVEESHSTNNRLWSFFSPLFPQGTIVIGRRACDEV